MANAPLPPYETIARSRAVLVSIARMGFLVLTFSVTLLFILNLDARSVTGETGFNLVVGWYIPLSASFVLAAIVLAIDYFTPQKKLSVVSGIVLGMLAGLLATLALGQIIDLIVQAWDLGKQRDQIGAVKVLFGICFCYLGIATVLQTQDDFRLIIPYVEFAKQIRGPKPILLDTSALIDARIADIAATGFILVPVVVPRFVIGELQALSDSSDKLKRAKGKRGLDIIARLQRMRSSGLDITIDEAIIPGKAVDQMLIELARTMPAIILTGDSGLVRVATIQNVPTLNINELANAVKPALLAGSTLPLNLIKPGEQAGQAVGFLEDGTMVVVDHAEKAIGTEARIEVTGSLQTAGGRLIFAKLASETRYHDFPAPAANLSPTTDSPPFDQAADSALGDLAEPFEPQPAPSAAQGETATLSTPPDSQHVQSPTDAQPSSNTNPASGSPPGSPLGPRRQTRPTTARNPRR